MGRPRKNAVIVEGQEDFNAVVVEMAENGVLIADAPKKRGRKPKETSELTDVKTASGKVIPKGTRSLKIRLTLIEDILGTLPSNDQVYRDYIASKAPNAMTIEDEVAALGEQGVHEKGVTVFARDENGNPFLYDYLIKGFFKNACKALRECKNEGFHSPDLKAYKSKIDNLVFPEPRKIAFQNDNPIEVKVFERPLRANTPQGERTALSASEVIPAGSYLDLTIFTMSADMMKFIPEWLDYGRFNGLGQWHNSGKGRFTWEILECN